MLTGLMLGMPLSVTAQSGIDAEADKLLRQSMSYLAGLQVFGLDSQTSVEVVLLTGQKIQFDDAVSAVVQRPNKFYAARRGDLVDQQLFYNGATLTMVDATAGYHASVDAPDTLEGMLDFARESLDIVAPAGDLLYADNYEILMYGVESGFVVGPAIVAGAVCDHLAFSAPGTDFQIWIQRGDKPLPRKMVITSRDVVNAPQFTVVIDKWDLEPDTSADRFGFEPDESSTPVEFIMLDTTSPR
jgi:hypothetical protein